MNVFWVEAHDGIGYTYRILVIARRVAVCTYDTDQYAIPLKFIGELWTDVAKQAIDRGHTWKILE